MGTWTSVELKESRNWRFGQRWDRQTLERVWLTRWVPANASDPYPGDGALATNLPVRPQQRLESAVHGTDATLKRYVCRSVNVEPTREAPYAWLVRATYDTSVFPWNSTDTWGAEYVKQTRTIGTRTISLYRRPTFTVGFSNGTQTWPPTADIGGTKVDINGNAQSYQIAQQTVVIEQLRDRTASSTTADDPNWPTVLTTYAGKRNSAAFLGWAIGSVLCTGIQASLDDEVWRISATFLFDDWYHLVQVPIAMPSGLSSLSTGLTIAGEQQRQTRVVVWFQPYPDTADFSTLYGATVSNQFTQAGPVRIP